MNKYTGLQPHVTNPPQDTNIVLPNGEKINIGPNAVPVQEPRQHQGDLVQEAQELAEEGVFDDHSTKQEESDQ